MFIVFGKKAFYAIFALLLVLTAATVSLLLPPEAVETSVSAPTGKTVWVIDAGHGGEDGGAVAADGSKESDMNLAIARRLDALLIFLGEETRMTRTEDISIHDASASTLREKKRSDLENRVGLVNSTQGAILVSIHQNSLPSSKQTHGAQVFLLCAGVHGYSSPLSVIFPLASGSRAIRMDASALSMLEILACPCLASA